MRSRPSPPARLAAPARSGTPARPALFVPAIAWTAWLTHLYTATGAALAFLSLAAIVSGNIRDAFVWLIAAVAVDASDGLLARAFRVHDRLPGIDGAHLDDIVDYLTFVFVPAFLLYHAGRLPAGWGLAVVFAMLVASAIAFSKSDAKTADHFFTGFPSYWNIVAFYLYVFGTPAGVNAVVLLVLCLLVFVRIGYVYPSRTTTLRGLTMGLGCAWGALLLYLLCQLPAVNQTLLDLSLVFPAYYTVLSLVLHARRPRIGV
jgi:phosphatidylcholine synthase